MDVQVLYDGIEFIVRGKFYPSRPAITWGPPENRERAEDAWWGGKTEVLLVTASGEEIDITTSAHDHVTNIDGRARHLHDYLLEQAIPKAEEQCCEAEAA